MAYNGCSFLSKRLLILVTPNTPLASILPTSSYTRNGFVISRTTGTGAPAIFGSEALTYNFSTISSSSATYYVQVYVARSNTVTNATSAWNITNCAVNMLVVK